MQMLHNSSAVFVCTKLAPVMLRRHQMLRRHHSIEGKLGIELCELSRLQSSKVCMLGTELEQFLDGFHRSGTELYQLANSNFEKTAFWQLTVNRQHNVPKMTTLSNLALHCIA
jgi:hypothetical protein